MAKKKNGRIKLHPEILEKNGEKQFVILPYEEFVILQERLADAEDLFELRQAIADDRGGPGLGLTKLKERLGLRKTAGASSSSAARKRRKAV